MRAGLAVTLSLLLLLSAFGPHVHAGAHGAEECSVCVVRGAEAAGSTTPDVTPGRALVGAAPLAPGSAPVTGAPLGAVPGQSPPRA